MTTQNRKKLNANFLFKSTDKSFHRVTNESNCEYLLEQTTSYHLINIVNMR